MSAEHGLAVTHPAWCDRTRCTAPAQQPTQETSRSVSEWGEHLSAKVVSTITGVTAYLAQAVAPWDCSVFLRLESNGSPFTDSIELDADSPLLLMIRQHVAEQQIRYPSLVPPLGDATEAKRA